MLPSCSPLVVVNGRCLPHWRQAPSQRSPSSPNFLPLLLVLPMPWHVRSTHTARGSFLLYPFQCRMAPLAEGRFPLKALGCGIWDMGSLLRHAHPAWAISIAHRLTLGPKGADLQVAGLRTWYLRWPQSGMLMELLHCRKRHFLRCGWHTNGASSNPLAVTGETHTSTHTSTRPHFPLLPPHFFLVLGYIMGLPAT